VDGAVEIYDENMQRVIDVWKPAYRGVPFKQLISLNGKCFFGPTWMVRRDPEMKYGFEDGITHGEDLLFYITIAAQGEYHFTEDWVLNYRKSASSTMGNLDGLARGYRTLGGIIFSKYKQDINLFQRMVFWYKVRKIMFLSFVTNREMSKAFRFLILGNI
jgi:hypothetical protein